MSLDDNLAKRLILNNSMIGLGQEFVTSIGNCYGQLAEAYLGSTGRGIIRDNIETYQYLFNTDVIAFATFNYMAHTMDNVESKYPKLGKLLNPTSDTYIQKIIGQISEVKPITNIDNISEITEALKTFGITEADEISDEDIAFEDEDEVVSKLGEAGFFDDFDLGDSDGEIEIEDDTSDIINTENQHDNTNEDIEIDLDSSESSSDDVVMSAADADQSVEQMISEGNKDQIEALKKAWGGKVSNIIGSIMTTYNSLYESGYGLISPAGVLTNQGILRSYSDGSVKQTGDLAIDIELFNAITKVTGNQFQYFSKPGEEIDIQKLIVMKEPLTLIEFHIRNMFGHLNYCKGKHSIRKYLTAHNIKNGSTTKVLKYADMRGYIKESVEQAFYEAYLAKGVTPDITPENLELVNYINIRLSKSLKNVIVVAERKNNVNTRLRICSDQPLDTRQLTSTLLKTLNIGTSSEIEVKQMGEVKNGVYDINIIYNSKSYSQDALFAYQVLDIIQEQDIKPSWSNVILGKKDDGTIMTYNFKDPNNSSVAMYGSKGSGKGVMTLNLIASALADGCALMYMDAKPDTAIPLTKVVWGAGKDACIFNGKETPGAGLEQQGRCVRQVDRFMSKQYIPQGLFNTKDNTEKFILLTTYYRGVELFLDLAESRASVVTNGGHNERWLVAIFDEVQQLASTEATVVTELENAKKARVKHKEEVDGKIKSINYFNDPIWKFIDDYERWRATLKDRMATALGSTFRKGEVTSIWIWQTTEFPGAFSNSSIIAHAILQESSSMVKVLGRGGAAGRNGSVVFGTLSSLTSNTTWYDDRFTGSRGGFWSIGNNVSSDTEMTVFRPFNVYSNASDKELLVTNAMAAGLTEQDLYGVSLNPDGTVVQEIGFEGYVNKLLAPYGIDAATQLSIGYEYANQSVIASGKARNLLEFMYNAHKFSQNTEADEFDEDETGVDLGTMSTSQSDFDDTNEFDSGEVIDFGDSVGEQGEQGDYQPQTPPTRGAAQNLSSDELEILKRAQQVKDIPFNDTDLSQYRGYEGQQSEDSGYTDEYSGDYGGYEDAGVADTEGFGEVDEATWDLDNPDIYQNGGQPSPLNQASTRAPNPSPEEVRTTHTSAYRFGTGRDAGYTFITPSRTSKILNLTPENSCVVTVTDHRSVGKMGKLMQSIRGTTYEFESRWKNILDAIARKQPPSSIVSVTIFNDAMIFNKRQVAAIGLIGGEDGVEVRDIVDFKVLAKKFRNIKRLSIDTDIYEASTVSLGDYPEVTMFNLMPSLLRLSIWKPGYGEAPTTYTRQSINSAQSQLEMQIRNERARLKQGIDTISAANNPRFGQRNPVDKARVLRASQNLTGAGWNKCKSHFAKDNYFRGSLIGMFTIGSAVVTSSIWGLTKLGSLFAKR